MTTYNNSIHSYLKGFKYVSHLPEEVQDVLGDVAYLPHGLYKAVIFQFLKDHKTWTKKDIDDSYILAHMNPRQKKQATRIFQRVCRELLGGHYLPLDTY